MLSQIEPIQESGDGTLASVERRSEDAHKRSNGTRSSRGNGFAEWDPSYESERIDWYSEYIARHATPSVQWLPHRSRDTTSSHTTPAEVTGMGLMKDRSDRGSDRVIGTLEDGSIALWNLRSSHSTMSDNTRDRSRQIACSDPGLLFANHLTESGSSTPKSNTRAFDMTESVSVDSSRQRAYIAVSDVLNEVDVETLQVVSQKRYAWPISALSQESAHDCPVTIGTAFSLHLHDPRERRGSAQEVLTSDMECLTEETKYIAFLPNYAKIGLPRWSLRSSRSILLSGPPDSPQVGPLSILHQSQNSIVLAGRFPSLLFYDRRRFPQLETTLHSGARLSGLASIDFPPKSFEMGSSDERIQTLVACGEYNGRGSLELYSVPHGKRSSHSLQDEVSTIQEEYTGSPGTFVYQNRQTASSGKLLSVATQGTCIVFSDSVGGLKWVERDGRSLVRRWNINEYKVPDLMSFAEPQLLNASNLNTRQVEASVQGNDAVRKMIPLTPPPGDRGERGDGDLLVWTGEKIGLITFHPQPVDDTEAAFEGATDAEVQEQAYDQAMREALERQADEFKWIMRFGTRYGAR